MAMPALELTDSEVAAQAYSDVLSFAAVDSPKFKVNWHLIEIADALNGVIEGRIRRLMINVPPRHGKTHLAVEKFIPCFLARRGEDAQVIFGTYNQNQADTVGDQVIRVIQGPTYRRVFGDPQLKGGKQKFAIRGNRRAYFFGLEGSATGKGADLLLIDDPVKNEQAALSPVIQEKTINWYKSTAFTRLQPNGAVIVIMTRWHENDLAGWIQSPDTFAEGDEECENWDDWVHVDLPALAIDDEPNRKKGEALWPEWYGRPALLRTKSVVGSRVWWALYQQRPKPEGGGIFKSFWFGLFDGEKYLANLEWQKSVRITLSIDCSEKDLISSDWSVVQVWAEVDNYFHLIDLWRDRVEFPDLERQVKQMAAVWKPDAILVEDKSNGTPLIQNLKRSTSLPVIAVSATKEKSVRANACAGMVEAGRVRLPREAPWLVEYTREMAYFPTAKNDDQVDATTQFLNWRKNRADGIPAAGADQSYTDNMPMGDMGGGYII